MSNDKAQVTYLVEPVKGRELWDPDKWYLTVIDANDQQVLALSGPHPNRIAALMAKKDPAVLTAINNKPNTENQ